MHHEKIELWQHQHVYNIDKKSIEKRTRIVVMITLLTMIAEIFIGWLTHSMALLADGWHMGTHAFALGISLLSYILARKYATDPRFTFGAWKIEILGAYSSAIILGVIGLMMIFASVERMINPRHIQYDQALFAAIVGLGVNMICAIILNSSVPSHEHGPGSRPDHHPDHDLNQKSAYLHVITDAMTSVLAITALLGAKYMKANWLDPFMGILGALLILHWAILLIRDTAAILIEREMDSPIVKEIKEEIESDGDSKISDLHVWRVAQNKYACIITVVTNKNITVDDYKMRLKKVHELTHVTVEIYPCKSNTT